MNVTRRDFLNGALLGTGAALLNAPPPLAGAGEGPAFDGPGGMGDYANSHGNPWRVLEAGHRIRDGVYAKERLDAEDTGESFDLLVVGAGMSGLGAALRFQKTANRSATCLLLENHPIFGGVSKRNEFEVDGQRLIAPQGANEIDIPTDPKDDAYGVFEQLGIPREFEYADWPKKYRRLEFDRTNYGYQYWIHAPSFGHRVKGRLVRDFWGKHASAELKQWVSSTKSYYHGDNLDRWLDSMSYRDYIEKVMGLSGKVTAYADPILAAAMGLGCDALSAYAARQVAMPGFHVGSDWSGFPIDFADVPPNTWQMFPGGNAGLARYAIKALIPEALPGDGSLGNVINQRVRFAALDRDGGRIRLRCGATVVRVEQDKKGVSVTYESGGRLYRVRARGVGMAGGATTARHIVRELPGEKREAFEEFYHSPVLVANVAVRHWRFLYNLGLTSARWMEGFGFCTNVRRPMILPGYEPPFSPDQPTVLTFYVPFYYPGLPAEAQGVKGRFDLFSTSYADYERRIREQMRHVFGAAAEKAIAGIILNRWGHAFVNPAPGFYFGRDGRKAPPDVIREPFGRITFAHSELFGHQYWLGAIREGRRAVDQLEERL